MTDALIVLKVEHRKMHRLFDGIRESTTGENRQSLCNALKHQLSMHTWNEESVFYPSFTGYQEFSKLLKEAYRNQRKIQEFMIEFEIASGPEKYGSKLDQLLRVTENHMRFQEHEFFPLVSRVLNHSRQIQLGELLIAARKQAELDLIQESKAA